MPIRLFKITGDSMSPAFSHNDYVVIFGHHKTRYRDGDVVLAKHPTLNTIIKRISRITPKGIQLAGDNPASTSSEQLGWLPHNCVIGKVIWHIHPRT